MEGQVWLVVAFFSIVGVVSCSPSAEPQLVYNSDGTPRLQIINTGAVGQPLQGRWSWQTPGGKSVWIQYPVNHQGFVPWTPAEYTYSVSSGANRNAFNVDERIIHLNTPIANTAQYQQQILRSDRIIDTQITNNNAQFPTLGQNHDQEDRFAGSVMDKNHGPVTERFIRPVSDKLHGPVFEKFPSSVSDKLHGQVFEKFPGQLSDKLYGPVMEKFPGPVMGKYSGPTESPVEVFTGRSDGNEDITDEVIPVTESIFDNFVINELDSTDFVERDDQVEDTTELGPVFRFTSRGRPQISNRIPEKQTSETRSQLNRPRPNNPPVPSLIVDPFIRQTFTRRPSTRVNSENQFRTRRPGITNQRRRLNFGNGRNTVTDNGIARLLALPEENSGRGVARSSPYTRIRVE